MLVTFFVIVLILVGLSLIALSIGILLKREGKFPEIHIGRNKHMKERGIHCANTTDAEERRNYHPIYTNENEKEKDNKS